jgi:hypothetical protein
MYMESYTFGSNQDAIFGWVSKFAPARGERLRELLSAVPKDSTALFNTITSAYFEAPDRPEIRTKGFFNVCDLLDGGYEY